jgi:Flp pilus assembly protein TadG
VAPLLLLLLAGVLNYGMALRTATSVATAARAGALYGSSSQSNASDTLGIQTAAINSAPDVRNLTVTSLCSCQCPDGAPVSCTGSCTGGNMLVYVRVTAQATSSAIFRYSGLGFSGNTAAQASMRAQ